MSENEERLPRDQVVRIWRRVAWWMLCDGDVKDAFVALRNSFRQDVPHEWPNGQRLYGERSARA